MNLRNATLFALLGVGLLTLLLAADFFNTVVGVLRDVVASVGLFRSLVHVLASLSLWVFLYVFYRNR